MSQNLWLLVEWVDERNIFPSYGVVNVNALVNDSEVHPGMVTFIRSKHGNSAKRAQILRFSDDKLLVKEHKMLLERQDHQVRGMLTMCMQTIREMKTDHLLNGSLNASTSSQAVKHDANSSGHRAASRLAHDDSDSDSDDEIAKSTRNLIINQRSIQTPVQKTILDHFSSAHYSLPPQGSQNQKPMTTNSSIPGPANHRQSRETPKLTFDQATQTDATLEVSTEKINRMESILFRLHQQFINLISGLRIEHQDNVPHEYQDGIVRQNFSENPEENLVAEQAPLYQAEFPHVPDLQTKELFPHSNAKLLHVRRVSAHTTNNVEQIPSNDRNTPVDWNELVPIGFGTAMVPKRVMNDIDWNSHTSATRQLLQALFPRKVLATSSLSGKPSPFVESPTVKPRLDPSIILDIIECVSRRCNVPEAAVRRNITIKCMDEAKMYRNRLENAKRPNNTSNQENLSPSNTE